MSDNAEKHITDEDKQFFQLLKSTETRVYRASSEENLLTNDLTRRRESQDYSYTTSGNSTSSNSSNIPENAKLE